MPRVRRKVYSNTAPIKIILLLVQFLLIKLGSLPIFAIKFLLKIRLPVIRLPSFSLPHNRRGRPRKHSRLLYNLNKFRLFIKRRIPKRVRTGLALTSFLIFFILYTQFIFTAAYELPTPEKLTLHKPTTTEIFDRNGKLLYRIYEGTNRSLVKIDQLPKHLILATVAAEDKNFYRHFGVDFVAIIRALYHNLRYGRLEGASTITQQLIKNTLLTSEKTYGRKVREIILALWTESKYSKEEILQMYFNEAPYGGPNWGIKAASKSYFDKEPKDLTLGEAAFLAGLPASPTLFSPYGNRSELGFSKQKQVLKRMLEENYITKLEFDKAVGEQLSFKGTNEDINAPHFVFYVREILAKKYGEKVVSQGGLKVTTTLDLNLQEKVEKIVSEEVEKLEILNVKNGAAMVLNKNGQILAMAGSRSYFYPVFGNFNSTLALRQPGSSIKPVTYATAFKKGYAPGNTILDTPVTFKDGVNSYSPVNYDNKFHGPISLRQALGSSLNIPAVKLLASIGLSNMIQTAKDLGITTFEDKNRFGLSLTLGGGEVTMIEMMGVYQTFSQMGLQQRTTGILKVMDSQGNILEEYENNPKQVLEPEIAYLITNILSDNRARTPAFGPSSLLYFKGQEVAVKTGTSDNKRDNWTFGYTPDFVAGVWVGNNDNSPMNPKLTSGITGAAPIWNRIMKEILSKNPSLGFARPSTIIEVKIDGRRDLAISGAVPKNLVRIRSEEDRTIFFDSFSSYATTSAQASSLDGATN